MHHFVSRYRLIGLLLLALVVQLTGCATQEKVAPKLVFPGGKGNSKAVNDALQLQGHPYVWGGASPAQGFDCSGLVVYVYNRQGVKLPRDTQSLARQLPTVAPEQRQPGDLLFFNTSKPFAHVGIYVGDNRFVHAPSSRTGQVMMSDLNQPYWRERFMGVRRPQSVQALSFNAGEETLCLLN